MKKIIEDILNIEISGKIEERINYQKIENRLMHHEKIYYFYDDLTHSKSWIGEYELSNAIKKEAFNIKIKNTNVSLKTYLMETNNLSNKKQGLWKCDVCLNNYDNPLFRTDGKSELEAIVKAYKKIKELEDETNSN